MSLHKEPLWQEFPSIYKFLSEAAARGQVTETTSITLLGLPLKERERLFPEVLGAEKRVLLPMDFGVFVSGLID
jgi:hypothetical protein